MPYTTEQIAAQQKVVNKLKEDIKWKEGVSYDFQSIDGECPTWNGTRADFWAEWRNQNPQCESCNAVYVNGELQSADDNVWNETYNRWDKHIMYDWWKFEMEYDDGYEVDADGSWATYIADKKSQLTTEEATLATMQADPA